MAGKSHRLFLFAAASIGGLSLLALLLMLFTQFPRSITSSPQSATPTPWVVATVDEDPILFDELQRAVALDWLMSALVDQAPPSPEETLIRLVNDRLVLRAAGMASLPKADQAQAEAWLASVLTNLGLEDAAFEQALERYGLTRSDLVGDIVPRLLQVQQALEELAPDANGEAWVADLRRQARVEFLEDLSDLVLLNLPTPTVPTASTPFGPSAQPTPPAVSLSQSPRAGELAPDFSLQATDKTTVRLSDLRGRPVILYFWALWCTPCREELLTLQADHGDDLIVLGIAVRESPDPVTAFAADMGLEDLVLLDPSGQVSDAYQVRGLPTSLFVDRKGVIVARHVGPLDRVTLDSYLGSLLATPSVPTPTP